MDLRGRTVLVTGASRGIGRALATELAGAGAHLALVARGRQGLEEVAASVPVATVHPCDLGDPGQVEGLIDRVEHEAGPVDVLVNNAGLEDSTSLGAAGADEVRRVFQVNLLTPAELCRQAVPRMLGRRRGHLVNMSSVAGMAALPGLAVYSSTKAGLTRLTAGLRADLRGLPIGTTLVEAGPVPTEMLERIGGYEPARRSLARFKRLQLLPETPKEVLAREVVGAILAGRRQVRLPRRAAPLAMLHEASQRATELLLSDIPHQP